MDICVINPFFYPYLGGTEKVLLEVYGRLAKRHNITVISAQLEGGRKETVDYVKGIKVIRVKSRYLKVPMSPLPFMWMNDVERHIRKEKADVYHVNNRYLYFLRTLLAIKGMRKRLVLTIHNSIPRNIDFPTDFSGFVYDLAWSRRMMSAADAITAVSKDALDVTVPARHHKKSRVIYNGVDAKLFRPISRTDRKVKALRRDADILITNNARLVPQKGQSYLIKAVSELAKERRERIRLTIIGKGPLEKRLLHRAGSIGVDLNITSGIPEQQLPYYYNASDAFVLPSLYEPAGAALLEALACETPSIATRIGGIPEYMRGYGYYVRDRNAHDIKEKLQELLASKERSSALARRAREIMIKEHDWNDIAKQYGVLFEELARR